MGVGESDTITRTVRDYLLNGGVYYAYFVMNDEQRVFQIDDIHLPKNRMKGIGSLQAEATVIFLPGKKSRNYALGSLLRDREATPEEVKRAKENQLAKKAASREHEDWDPHGKNPFIKDGPVRPHPNKKY